MFISEDDPFRLTAHEQTFKKNIINQSSTFHSSNNSHERTPVNFDSSFTDFTQTIVKYLLKAPYQENIALFNPFCPLCAKFVSRNEFFTMCNIKSSQNFIIHDKCLTAHPSFQMNLISDQEDDMTVVKNSYFKETVTSSKNSKSLSLQFRQFLIQIIFYHPISQKKFGKIQRKEKIAKEKDSLEIKLYNIEIQDQFSPNMIVLPLTDYLIEISIDEIGQQKKQKIRKYLNFKKMPSQNMKQITFGNQQLQLQLSVISEQNSKQVVLDEMNYKYAFPVDKLSLVLIKKIWLQLPEDFQQSESDEYEEIMESRSSKVLEFLEMDSKLQDQRSQTSRKSSQCNVSFDSYNSRSKQKDTESKYRRKSKNPQKSDHQKVNLDKLINSGTLKEFVKNNTQSRSFQCFLQKAANQDIDKIIDHLKKEFCDLMKHEYGNYMMQKLFSVCNLQRRVTILEALIPQLTEIVMNKQGTHAFQDFLSFFTTEEQYILVLNKIKQNFFELCIHNNATHFVQKIVKMFPMQLLNQFYYYSVQNLYQFACDKNGMCVIKHMLKKLNQISEKTFDKSPLHLQTVKLAEQYKKWFVQATLCNLDAIIGDMYGNYVVQFNFELFQPNLTYAVADTILMKLPQYSLSKYSTNVVYKCLNVYWVNNKEYVSNVLKEVFQPYLILEMYKNKDGNKILLQLMEKYEGKQIWNRLYNTLISTEPTRFYHDRWGVCLGSRSGNVGGNWNSFSDAVQKLSCKRKNKRQY